MHDELVTNISKLPAVYRQMLLKLASTFRKFLKLLSNSFLLTSSRNSWLHLWLRSHLPDSKQVLHDEFLIWGFGSFHIYTRNHGNTQSCLNNCSEISSSSSNVCRVKLTKPTETGEEGAWMSWIVSRTEKNFNFRFRFFEGLWGWNRIGGIRSSPSSCAVAEGK